MYILLVLLLALSNCSLSGVSSSYFPDSFFDSVASGTAPTPDPPFIPSDINITITKPTKAIINDTLSLAISASFTNIIKQFSVETPNSTNVILLDTCLAEVTFSSNITLQYNSDFLKSNSVYPVKVSILGVCDESYEETTNLDITIKSVQGIKLVLPTNTMPRQWSETDMFSLTVERTGAGIKFISPSDSLTGTGTYCIFPNPGNEYTISGKMSAIVPLPDEGVNLINSKYTIAVYSEEGNDNYTVYKLSEAIVE